MGLNIIQIGANQANDDLSTILSTVSPLDIELLVLVEPFVLHHSSLSHFYKSIPNKLIISGAVVPNLRADANTLTLWYHVADAPRYEVASLDKSHILKHKRSRREFEDETGYRSLEVPALTINQLVSLLQLSAIDLLFIDAEGFDVDIVKSVNLDLAEYRNIVFEHKHCKTAAAMDETLARLENSGLSIQKGVLSNRWMTHAYKHRDNLVTNNYHLFR